jgi:hypothetical protein
VKAPLRNAIRVAEILIIAIPGASALITYRELQTTTIECRKTGMQCQESSAVLAFVGENAIMESAQTSFDIDHWDEWEIVTKSVRGKCVDRMLVLSLAEKRASTRVSPARSDEKCAESAERVLELVADYKARGEALRKASPF